MFQKWVEKALVEGKEKEIEVRKDAFWQRRCRIIGRVGLELTAKENFDEIIKKPCIFCMPEKLAKFGNEFGSEMFENEHAFLFPNINPYARYSSVCAFKKHYIKLEEFKAEIIEKNLELCIEYIKKVMELDDIKYASINWNYLMPAGASILHPHTQVVADEHSTTYMEKVAENGEQFREYIKKEMESERFIGEIGNISLFTPFVPFGFNEVVGIVSNKLFSSINEIAQALEAIISYYESIGRNSFNVCIYASLNDEFSLHFRCITRQNMAKYYRNDAMFFERLHSEVILEKKPEEVAKEIKEYLEKRSK